MHKFSKFSRAYKNLAPLSLFPLFSSCRLLITVRIESLWFCHELCLWACGAIKFRIKSRLLLFSPSSTMLRTIPLLDSLEPLVPNLKICLDTCPGIVRIDNTTIGDTCRNSEKKTLLHDMGWANPALPSLTNRGGGETIRGVGEWTWQTDCRHLLLLLLIDCPAAPPLPLPSSLQSEASVAVI